MRLRFKMDKPRAIGDISIRASPSHADALDGLLKLASRDRLVLDDLLNIAQYDLSARPLSTERSV